jgi:NAD(P)-dependent dehydrogenase (short-subunit alcohol dehydrogenase family)
MKRLKDKVAIVTGGNSGIGKGIANHFFQEGAKVVIFGRNQQTLDQASEEMENKILAIHGDVTHTQDLKNLYEQTLSHYGKVDILVANSGVGERLHVSNVTEEKFDYMVNINYRGVYFTVHYALPHLHSNASIILISSCAATITLKHQSVYASTKAAVLKLAKNLSYDLAENGIRINSISPGYIRTPIFDERLQGDPDYLSKREERIPLRRIGTPQDIANAALFLASDESSYITGIDLLVDGGYCASYPE